FFLADEQQRRGKRKKAVATYAELVAKHPKGDMAEEAQWRRAWLAYRSGEPALAKQRLDTFLRGKPGAEVHVTEHQLRARYWRATLQPPALRKASLKALISEHPGTWQALLAATVLPPETILPSPLKGLVALGQKIAPSPALLSDPRFTKALALMRLELKEQALHLLERIPVKSLSASDLLPLAQALIESGGAAEAVGRLRGAPALRSAPQAGDEAIFKLAFPLPFSRLILEQAKANKIPPALLFGLIREESGFNAKVLSWAGAKGLTQCMPPTARMVARRHKVRGYSWADMDQPELNLRIGSLYLGGLLKRWKGVLPLAVGSYNAGPGAMSRMRKKRPNLALDVWVEEISIRQTREYVQRVLASAWTYAQLYPELGGLDLNMMGMR
ncbi:MAG: lytic transglycosylase domain-containing protein, partial [Myxococcota bacterium]|nr:lytic transglycosylase domain-containing protein [Myxococcota bacterium]